MQVKILAKGKYKVVGAMEGDTCPAEDFLHIGEKATIASRSGLLLMLQHAADVGLDQLPSAWQHEANKKEKIYEFIKGDLRLFFFKGANGDIAVCTGGAFKKGQKADKSAVKKAIAMRATYMASQDNITYTEDKDVTQ